MIMTTPKDCMETEDRKSGMRPRGRHVVHYFEKEQGEEETYGCCTALLGLYLHFPIILALAAEIVAAGYQDGSHVGWA